MGGSSAPGSRGGGRRFVLVADAPGRAALPLIREAHSLRRYGCTVDCIVRPELVDTLGRYQGFGTVARTDQDIPERFLDGVTAVWAVPSRDLLARMALGLEDSAGAAVLIEALLRGIPVYMDMDRLADPGGDAARDSRPGGYFRDLYARYAASARDMGVLPVSGGRYTAALLDSGLLAVPDHTDQPAADRASNRASDPGVNPGSNPGQSRRLVPASLSWLLPEGGRKTVQPVPGVQVPPGEARADFRSVITERDVLARLGGGTVPANSEWIVPHDALITPLARDTARQKGLVIRKDEKPRG